MELKLGGNPRVPLPLYAYNDTSNSVTTMMILLDYLEVLLEKLFPVIKRCLGKDENYDLRMDAAMVSHMTLHHDIAS